MLAQGPVAVLLRFLRQQRDGGERGRAEVRAPVRRCGQRGPGHEKLLCFSGAFHGRTLGLAFLHPVAEIPGPLPAASARRGGGPVQRRAGAAGDPHERVCGRDRRGDPGRRRPRRMTPEFAQALNEACRKASAILIVDEVQTGITRTGDFFASEGVGLVPGHRSPWQSRWPAACPFPPCSSPQRSTTSSTRAITERHSAAARSPRRWR